MEPQHEPLQPDAQTPDLEIAVATEPVFLALPPPQPPLLKRIFVGDQGDSAGWSVLFFILLFFPFAIGFGKLASLVYPPIKKFDFTAPMAFVGEMVPFLAMLLAATIVAFIERHSILAYNLAGRHRTFHFFGGLAAGFLSLSALIGASTRGLAAFWPHRSQRRADLKYGVIWACAFLVVGFVEEGMFRCFLQATLTRSINFWWALGTVGTICIYLAIRTKGNGVWGVYVVALLGLIPCLMLHLKKTPGAGFWQAAWVTSTLFGMIHTSNNGEKLDRYLCSGLYRIRVLRECVGYRICLVGDRLSRRLGLERDLFLWGSRQRECGEGTLPLDQPGGGGDLERWKRRSGGKSAGAGRCIASYDRDPRNLPATARSSSFRDVFCRAALRTSRFLNELGIVVA